MSDASTIRHDVILPAETGDTLPAVRSIDFTDIEYALREGVEDFRAMPTHALFIGVLYAIAGLLLGRAALGYELVTLIFPLAAGFALIGPFAALGLYELSRRREMGRDTSWRHLFDFTHLPTFWSIVGLGVLLVVLFLIWIAVADGLYISYFGHRNVTSFADLLNKILGSPQGREFFVVGNAVGLLFAIAAFVLSVISFPLLLDRHVSLPTAMATSLKVVLENPVTMLGWALIVAGGLFLGALPALAGLAIVVPVLGHATWHLYRRALEPAPSERPEYVPKRKHKRYAAQFPMSLFAGTRELED